MSRIGRAPITIPVGVDVNTASAPLLIVLDDLHWADRPTLQLLRHLIRSPQSWRS